MREVLRTNDAALLGLAESLLRQAGIARLIADQHISVQEGSIGAFPRRLLVRICCAARYVAHLRLGAVSQAIDSFYAT